MSKSVIPNNLEKRKLLHFYNDNFRVIRKFLSAKPHIDWLDFKKNKPNYIKYRI